MQAAGDQAVLNTLPMGDHAGRHVHRRRARHRRGARDERQPPVRLRPTPTCESVVLNDAYSQGAGSTYKTFVAAAALERGSRSTTR